MTWRDKLELGLKEDAAYRKDNLPPSQIRGPELPTGPGGSPEIPLAGADRTFRPSPMRARAPRNPRRTARVRPGPAQPKTSSRTERHNMRIAGIVLLAVGILALVYGGFTYTTETHQANIGPLDFSITEKERVNVPVWVGVAFTVVGAGLLLKGKR